MHRPYAISVLIADPDARVRHALRALIEGDPRVACVAEASSARETIEVERQLDPTVILVDVCLPRPDDGLALIHALAQERGHPVVAMSLHSGLRAAALKAGARAFLDKGAEPDQVMSILFG